MILPLYVSLFVNVTVAVFATIALPVNVLCASLFALKLTVGVYVDILCDTQLDVAAFVFPLTAATLAFTLYVPAFVGAVVLPVPLQLSFV